MSYVDKNLLPGETITYRTRLHWKASLGAILLALLVCLPLALLAVFLLEGQARWIAVVPGLAGLIAWLVAHVQRTSSEFAVTNRRLIIKLGVFSIRTIELMLPKIEAISVSQSLGGRMWDYGDIVVTGSGGTKEPFAGIQAPEKFRRAVQLAAHEAGGGVSATTQ